MGKLAESQISDQAWKNMAEMDEIEKSQLLKKIIRYLYTNNDSEKSTITCKQFKLLPNTQLNDAIKTLTNQGNGLAIVRSTREAVKVLSDPSPVVYVLARVHVEASKTSDRNRKLQEVSR